MKKRNKRNSLTKFNPESFAVEAKEKIMKIIISAGSEFHCQSCDSKDECSNFKWFGA
jgi:hypothetical protein